MVVYAKTRMHDMRDLALNYSAGQISTFVFNPHKYLQ